MYAHMPAPMPPDNTGKTYKTNKPEDARVRAFKQFYLDIHNTDTFCNIRQSALRAGYSEDYANNISGRLNPPKWWIEFKETQDFIRADLLRQSEQHFYDVLQTPKDTNDLERYKLKQRTAEFVSERVGKEVYSTRQELTGADGRRLIPNEARDAAKMPLATLFAGVQAPPSTS